LPNPVKSIFTLFSRKRTIVPRKDAQISPGPSAVRHLRFTGQTPSKFDQPPGPADKTIDKVKAQGGTRVCDVIDSICEEEMTAPTSDII